MSDVVEIEQSLTIRMPRTDKDTVYLELSLDEAIVLKNALIRAVGAQTHSTMAQRTSQIARRECPSCGDQCRPGHCINRPA